MESIPHPTYEEAVRQYLARFRSLMQPSRETNDIEARGTVELPVETLVQRAAEIAGISSGMIDLAQDHLNSADPRTREGIRYHFIDQAAVELLLGIELLHISEVKTGTASPAAIKATHGAALREAVSDAEKSSSVPVTQGLPEAVSHRASESANLAEAVAGLKLAVESAASSIARRVQELGGDIAFDLVSGMQWTEVVRGASLSFGEIETTLKSIPNEIAGSLLLNVYRKISALLSGSVEAEARLKIREWLEQMKQADRIDVFNAKVEDFYHVALLGKLVSEPAMAGTEIEPVNRASDRVKSFSDKFMVLTGRIRKLEDAIRLGKPVNNSHFRLVTLAMQVSLLAALVYAGRDYIKDGVTGILPESTAVP